MKTFDRKPDPFPAPMSLQGSWTDQRYIEITAIVRWLVKNCSLILCTIPFDYLKINSFRFAGTKGHLCRPKKRCKLPSNFLSAYLFRVIMAHLSRFSIDIYILLIFLQMYWGHMSKLNIIYFLPLIFKFPLPFTLYGVCDIFPLVSYKSGLQAVNYTSVSWGNELNAFSPPVI